MKLFGLLQSRTPWMARLFSWTKVSFSQLFHVWNCSVYWYLLDSKSAHALMILLDSFFYWWYWQYLRLSKVTRWFLVAIMLAGWRSLMFTCAREVVSSISPISQMIGEIMILLQSAHRSHVRNCFASGVVEDVAATTYLNHLPSSFRIRTSWFLFHYNLWYHYHMIIVRWYICNMLVWDTKGTDNFHGSTGDGQLHIRREESNGVTLEVPRQGKKGNTFSRICRAG